MQYDQKSAVESASEDPVPPGLDDTIPYHSSDMVPTKADDAARDTSSSAAANKSSDIKSNDPVVEICSAPRNNTRLSLSHYNYQSRVDLLLR